MCVCVCGARKRMTSLRLWCSSFHFGGKGMDFLKSSIEISVRMMAEREEAAPNETRYQQVQTVASLRIS